MHLYYGDELSFFLKTQNKAFKLNTAIGEYLIIMLMETSYAKGDHRSIQRR